MNMKRQVLNLILLLLVGAAFHLNAQTSTPAEAEASFVKFYEVVAKANQNKVTVAVMLDAMNAQDSDPKAVSRIKAWDKNRDGLIDRQEGTSGVTADLMAYVEEQMKTDSDGDGVLSTSEYVFAVSDPTGEKTPSGLTRRQEIMFKSADTNKDNKYSRAESIAANAYRNQHSYVGRAVAYRARVFDLNADRKYDLTEFALLYGVQPGEAVPPPIQEKFNGKAGSVPNHNYYNVMMRLIHLPLNELAELDARITAYEKQPGKAAISAK